MPMNAAQVLFAHVVFRNVNRHLVGCLRVSFFLCLRLRRSKQKNKPAHTVTNLATTKTPEVSRSKRWQAFSPNNTKQIFCHCFLLLLLRRHNFFCKNITKQRGDPALLRKHVQNRIVPVSASGVHLLIVAIKS